MGNDGGSIPRRRELVKEAARLPTASEQKATALESLSHAWSMCPLSSSPLDAGITVSDWRGRMYNYEAILQCLMPTPDSTIPETQELEFARTDIKSLKDVVKLKFMLRKDEKGREFRACPVSLKELGAATKAVYVVPCGHVFTDVAMREVTEAEVEKRCPECSEPFQERDVVPILPIDEAEVDKSAKRLEELKTLGLTHSLKKDKSASKKKRKAEDAAKDNGSEGQKNKDTKASGKTDKNKGDISSRINNSMTASLTAKVLAEQEERNKRRRMVDGYKRSEVVR
ncbi:Uu.00g120370.m01.CDS01 [Anthostomella pinea]|uniref:Uu.00g120370.m01.CDS01 n=1 Tax=Anthostomella pinea TaxID=933095 RepID=A0AAI8VGQ3_9PEZI|nr:Uu.00g120370.m01.CDS01 [Anthostomella pinea]